MKIIITMAGLGKRFKKIGIKKPKYEIIANKKSLYEWSMLSLKDFFEEEFLFIIRKEIFDESFIEKINKSLGITNYKFIELNKLTDGQASTAYSACKYIENKEAVIIYNIDTYIKPYELKKSDINANDFGFIPVVHENGDRWSFVKINDAGKVIEVAEKKQISNLASIGFYYFKYWEDYKIIYSKHHNEIKIANNEVYIAPMYQYMLNDNKNIGIKILQRDKVHILGTPEEIENFDRDYLKNNL